MENVVSALTAQGFEISWNPKLVSAEHAAAADRLVSIGCDHDAIPTDAAITEWDVPMISADLMGSLRAIHAQSEAMVAEMAVEMPRSTGS